MTAGARRANPRSANGHRWRQAKARLRGRGDQCWICMAFGRPSAIDYSLGPSDPMSFSADHLVPVSKGGAMYADDNLAAAHRRCNEWRRDRSVASVIAIARASRGRPRVATSTEW